MVLKHKFTCLGVFDPTKPGAIPQRTCGDKLVDAGAIDAAMGLRPGGFCKWLDYYEARKQGVDLDPDTEHPWVPRLVPELASLGEIRARSGAQLYWHDQTIAWLKQHVVVWASGPRR